IRSPASSAATTGVGTSRSTSPIEPKSRLTPSGSGASPGTVTSPSADDVDTGPPWKSTCGAVTTRCHPGSTESTSADSGLLSTTPWAPSSSWWSMRMTDRWNTSPPTDGVATRRRPVWNVELTGPAFHTGDRSEASAATAAALVVAPPGDEAVTAFAPMTASVVPSVVATATVVGARAATLALARAARAGRPSTVLLGTCDEALEVVLGDGDTTGRRRTGGRDDRVAGRGPDRRDLEAGVLELTLHGLALVRQREGHDGALVTGASRAARAVQVVLVVRRRVDLQDDRDVVDVDAAGGDVGRDEHREGAVTEGAEDAVALALVEAAVERGRHDALLAQLERDAVGAELGATEDDGATVAVRDLGRDDLLVLRVDEQDVVVHALDRRGGVVRRVRHRVGEVLLDERVDAAVERRREEEALAVGRDLVEARRDLGHEAHLGHVVGLVEHGDRDVVHLDGATLEQVVETARRRDEDVDALVERVDLRRVAEATGDELVAQAGDVHERLERVGDLHRELARRRQDEGVRLARATLEVGLEQPGDERQAEGKGLARAGLAAAEDVLAGQRVGDRRGLDRERRGDALPGEALDEPLGQAESGEAVVGGDVDGSVGHVRAGRLGPGVGVHALGLGVVEAHGSPVGGTVGEAVGATIVAALEARAVLAALEATTVATTVIAALERRTVLTALVTATVVAVATGPVERRAVLATLEAAVTAIVTTLVTATVVAVATGTVERRTVLATLETAVVTTLVTATVVAVATRTVERRTVLATLQTAVTTVVTTLVPTTVIAALEARAVVTTLVSATVVATLEARAVLATLEATVVAALVATTVIAAVIAAVVAAVRGTVLVTRGSPLAATDVRGARRCRAGGPGPGEGTGGLLSTLSAVRLLGRAGGGVLGHCVFNSLDSMQTSPRAVSHTTTMQTSLRRRNLCAPCVPVPGTCAVRCSDPLRVGAGPRRLRGLPVGVSPRR